MEDKWKALTKPKPSQKLIDEFKLLPEVSKRIVIKTNSCWRLLINLHNALGTNALAALVKDNVNFKPIALIYREGSMGAKSSETIPTIAELFDADESIARQIIDCEDLRLAICTELKSFYSTSVQICSATLMNRHFFEQFISIEYLIMWQFFINMDSHCKNF
jgi:hypothetical protein